MPAAYTQNVRRAVQLYGRFAHGLCDRALIKARILSDSVNFWKSHGPSNFPLERPSLGFECVATWSKHGRAPKAAMRLQVSPTMQSVWCTLALPFTRQERAPLLSTNCIRNAAWSSEGGS